MSIQLAIPVNVHCFLCFMSITESHQIGLGRTFSLRPDWGNHPKIAEIFRLVKFLQFTHILYRLVNIYAYIIICEYYILYIYIDIISCIYRYIYLLCMYVM